MKRVLLIAVLCVAGWLMPAAHAQISVNVNIPLQPVWGPVGYDHVDFYYLPEISVYYSVPMRMFFYLENGRWVNRAFLPTQYRNYDLYRARKIVINEPRPYLRDNVYRARYLHSNEGMHQTMIRDSHDSRYFEIKEHPEHSKWRNHPQNHGQEMKQMNQMRKEQREDQKANPRQMNNQREEGRYQQPDKKEKKNGKDQRENNQRENR